MPVKRFTLSVYSGILSSRCPAVITDRQKISSWRHFVFPSILPVLFHCPFVNCDVQSLSARRANQHLVTFEMTIWVSVKSETSLCLTATHYLGTSTRNKAGQSEQAGLYAICKTGHIRAQRWLWDWGHCFSFIRSGNAKLNWKGGKPLRKLVGRHDKMSVSSRSKIISKLEDLSWSISHVMQAISDEYGAPVVYTHKFTILHHAK